MERGWGGRKERSYREDCREGEREEWIEGNLGRAGGRESIRKATHMYVASVTFHDILVSVGHS